MREVVNAARNEEELASKFIKLDGLSCPPTQRVSASRIARTSDYIPPTADAGRCGNSHAREKSWREIVITPDFGACTVGVAVSEERGARDLKFPPGQYPFWVVRYPKWVLRS